MALSHMLRKNANASRRLRGGAAVAGIAALGLSLALSTAKGADAATMTRPLTATGTVFGTLDTQPGTVAAEAGSSSVSVAMLEFNWASFEPGKGVFSASYLATMESYLRAYQAAGMKVTLGLGLQNTPSWVYALPDATYVNQAGQHSAEANFVFSAAVRQAAAGYLAQIAAGIPLSNFWAIRLTSGGDGEMLYPGGGTYWAFDTAALTGTGLAAGLTPNPYPAWKPGTPGLAPAQIGQWVNWYVGGLDSVTNWQMQALAGLGFTGYYQAVTPGSGTRPDGLAADEQQNLPDDATTGVGAVWDRYYAMLPNKASVVAYISSVADESGGDDSCQPADTAIPLTSPLMDSWSATRWITRIALADDLPVGGENVGYGIPASLSAHYLDASSAGMMADALRQSQACGFQVFYWAHDIHLQDGTIPFTRYAASIAPYATAPANLAPAAALAPSSALQGFPAANANDSSLSTYWQAITPAATLTLRLAQPAAIARIIVELPKDWGTRSQAIEVDGSTNGTTWTTLAPSTPYQFTAGSNAIAIPLTPATQAYLRLDLSANNVQGAPQIAELQAYSS
jgi:F5/8 type C domain/Beta-galactosidase